MTLEEFANSGIVDKCCKNLGVDEDVAQEVYLLVCEKCAENPEYINRLSEGYVFVMCRTMAFNKSSKYNTKMRVSKLTGDEPPGS